MAMLAMWWQQTDMISSGNAKLLTVFIGLVAVAMVTQAIATVGLSMKAGKALKEATQTLEEIKAKALPVLESARAITETTQSLLAETAPKVKVITENVLQTSALVKTSAQRFDASVADANVRAQRQMARIDGMVTAALTTTAEVAATIEHGIKVPAQKIAGMAVQVKTMFDGALAKAKSMVASSPFGGR
jgi:hypothetical protein